MRPWKGLSGTQKDSHGPCCLLDGHYGYSRHGESTAPHIVDEGVLDPVDLIGIVGILGILGLKA